MKKLLFTLLTLMLISGPVHAFTTLDFEGLPDLYYYWGGNTNIGNYLSGVTFGPDATILDQNIYGYNSGEFPPRSGDAVLFTDEPTQGLITAQFDQNVNFVSLWYTANTQIWLEAFDSGDGLIDTDTGLGGNFGQLDYLEVSSSFFDIAYIQIHDGGNTYTIDDLTFNPVPEPATVILMGMGLIGLYTRARKRKK